MYARLINCSCMKNNSQSPSNDDEQTKYKSGGKIVASFAQLCTMVGSIDISLHIWPTNVFSFSDMFFFLFVSLFDDVITKNYGSFNEK